VENQRTKAYEDSRAKHPCEEKSGGNEGKHLVIENSVLSPMVVRPQDCFGGEKEAFTGPCALAEGVPADLDIIGN